MTVTRRLVFIVSFVVAGALAWAGTGPNTTYVALGVSSSEPMRLVRDTGFLYFTHDGTLNGSIYRVALP